MHVTGDDGRRDVGGVVIADVENVVTSMLMRADQFGEHGSVIAQKRVGDHAPASREVLA